MHEILKFHYKNPLIPTTPDTHSFFCKFRNVIESPYPTKASSNTTLMLFALKSRCRNRCRGLNASLGITCKLLSPKRKYWRFSATNEWMIERMNINDGHNWILLSVVMKFSSIFHSTMHRINSKLLSPEFSIPNRIKFSHSFHCPGRQDIRINLYYMSGFHHSPTPAHTHYRMYHIHM